MSTPTSDPIERAESVPRVRFEPTGAGVAVVDPIEGRRDVLRTRPSVDPEPVPTESVPAPVGAAARVELDRVGVGRIALVIVRDAADWTTLAHLEENGTETFPPGEYVVEVSGPIKLYLHVEGGFTVSTDEETRFEFGSGAAVTLAARSNHNRPATTVTTTDDPEDLMAAISAFGSALKTTTPERSWPTLRGHPPLVEVGDERSIPGELVPPSPEVRLVVPPRVEFVYPVAPLAYYLGARVVPGATPRIETDEGFEYPLGAGPSPDEREFERRVERTLRRVVFLECLARTKGLTQLPLRERADVEGRIDVDLDALYDLDPAPRLRRILSVSHESVADRIPDWELASHLAPDPQQAELLPYLVADLALVRTRSGGTAAANVDRTESDQLAELNELLRNEDEVLLRSSGSVVRGDDATDLDRDYVQFHDGESDGILEEIWAGDATPIGASHTTQEAYRNRLRREPSDPPIDVAVVCNDPEMAAELGTADIYDGEDLPFDVRIYRDLSTAALRTLIEHQETDFLHYIGHANTEGLRCSDGRLDLGTLTKTGVNAFLLNACQSYEQGLSLIGAGAVGGVVTLDPVPDRVAALVGETMARLLNAGYPLRSALRVVRDEFVIGNDYLIVGDGGIVVGQSSVAPIYSLGRVDSDTFTFQAKWYPSNTGVGGVATCHLEEIGYHLLGNSSPEITVDQEKLENFLYREEVPIRVKGVSDLCWSSELSLDEIDVHQNQ
ncbi:hypothetical protein BRD00_02220 [Halobacteriales archaeon QS_8_69_26]|nr:MAG: hypothetical protein BRD00_02220 [Halobacteriales archaeon QS_8_69_26]